MPDSTSHKHLPNLDGLLTLAGGGRHKLTNQISDPLAVQFHTFSACYELGIGCLLALALHNRQPQRFTVLPYLALFLPLPINWHLLLRPLISPPSSATRAFARAPGCKLASCRVSTLWA